MVFDPECERCRERVSRGLDVVLSDFESALLRGHVSGCKTCRVFAVEVRATTMTLRALSLVKPSAISPPCVSTKRSAKTFRATLIAAAFASAAAAVFTPGVGGGSRPTLRDTVRSVAQPATDDLFSMRAVRSQQLRAPASSTNIRVRVLEVD
jgi:predicted anti-sigma-YlaC factor YlaD